MGTISYLLLSAFALSLCLLRVAPAYSIQSSLVRTFLAIFSIQFSAFAIWKLFLYPHIFSPLRYLPKVPGGSLIAGQFPTILRDPNGVPMERWINEIPNEGLILYHHMFNNERVLVTSPKALAEVLVAKSYTFIKPDQLRRGLGQVLGFGILLAEGDEHKRQRKHLMPAFAFRHIKDLYPVFWSKAREVTNAMAAEVHQPDEEGGVKRDSAVFDAASWPSRVTLDIIGVAGMAQDFRAVQDEESTLYKTYRTVFRSPSGAAKYFAIAQFVFPSWFLRMLPFSGNSRNVKAAETIKDVSRDLIRAKREKLEKGESTDVDIISVALQSGGFCDEDLVNQLMTFLAAGHETTASSMAWASYLLCEHRDVQERLREEVRTSLPSLSNPNSSISAAELDRLPYLNAVCNEASRLLPPVALTLRIAAHDTTILGNRIPKGTTVILAPWAVNRSKELWGQDAAEFKPERWLAPGKSNSGGAESNFSFLTFLHGPRSCIGQNFAKAEFACLLAAWVGRFDISFADPDYRMEPQSGGPTSKPKNLMLNMKPLDGW
ncbi:cytochrome P450 [Eremomyces bilateralis CBS 781.70]|uniref:Cytochrome P450 n=1 Tax=Eremomyces bilateralis CBS 781.70 TaxID=1392243 RepID=A0A6G1FVC9_9PEZI|nr:cytochrome P450 [Eremomyces bilateralis CBS 781.70]KAF1809744.1 cytochrome P450 [Eremomyces bilateralis CBS 781.70]